MFGWLIGEYLSKVSRDVNGTVVYETKHPFSTEIMDAAFDFSTEVIKAIRFHLAEKNIEISSVSFLTAMTSNLERKSTVMKTDSSLIVVRDSDGKNHALFFTGCSLDERIE